MKFPDTLVTGILVRRYKRFLADIELDSGEIVVAHCANPGAMTGLNTPGFKVWLAPNRNPKAKLDWRWELVQVNGYLIGINTAHPNAIVAEAINAGKIDDLKGYESLRREVKYGRNSRIDILLEDDDRPPCHVEIKNVHFMREPGIAEFPDSVTARGAKHLDELADVAAAGGRAVMLYVVQRGDCRRLRIAGDLDPTYAKAFARARASGVEALAHGCKTDLESIVLADPLIVEA